MVAGMRGLLAGVALTLASCNPARPSAADFGARIVAADREPQNWLSTGRGYDETRFSALGQINQQTIGRLSLAWSYDLDTDRGQEATPLAVDGMLFTTSAWSKVQAFDAVTGRLRWQFDPKVPGAAAAKACCDVVNRGVAYWHGRVYVGTIDGRLIALDADTGEVAWSVQTTDPASNNTITGAPRVVKGRVVIGNGGAELGARGFITAYDAATGKKAWRFYIVPGDPTRPDGEISDEPLRRLARPTWSGRWWTHEGGGGGGGTAWDSMAYDPELDLLYVGTGNASYWNKAFRSPGDGDNLFVGSVLALRPDTGEYVWHYQETPGDEWDYTSTQNMILATVTVNGTPRRVLMHAPKNGYFYLLDRATGKLLSAKPYIPLTWSRGIDPKSGRPDIVPAARYDLTGRPWTAMPGGIGGHNWQPMSFSSGTGLVYIPVQEVPGLYSSDPGFVRRAVGTNTGNDMRLVDMPSDPAVLAAALKVPKSYLLAWDPARQREVWRSPNPGMVNGGVLSTAGGLVFQGDNDGRFNVYAAADGRKLWSFDAQNPIMAAPVTYSVKGRQYVTVVVGFGGAVALVGGQAAWGRDGPRRNKSRVLTFALDGKAAPLPTPALTARSAIVAPAAAGDAASVEAGRALYLNTCAVCHGAGAKSAGVLPDLRRSAAIANREAFASILIDGTLTDRGMVSFARNYDRAQVETIRAYLVSRAREDAGQR